MFYSLKLDADLILGNNLLLMVAQMGSMTRHIYQNKANEKTSNIQQHLNKALQSAKTLKQRAK